jgi:hypothetical protein
MLIRAIGVSDSQARETREADPIRRKKSPRNLPIRRQGNLPPRLGSQGIRRGGSVIRRWDLNRVIWMNRRNAL